nr:RNA-directed DNA polymerase, eukaryota [Tanacetum cinerariifolium]
MGAHNKNSLQSKADQTVRISKSVFVSNFPDGCTAKDLWKVCNDYGIVVDVFIPNKKSKVGKRFVFVKFIKVINLDCLIENLSTIWIGRFHLFANPVRFERPKKPNISPHNNANAASSYPLGVDQAKVLALDDSCVAERDLSNHVMGFSVVNLVYLGGLWMMIECDNVETKANIDERIVWVDIEGISLNVWSRETFTRIGKKWGEALDIEDNVDSSFGRKRLCIKTKLPLSILKSFKVIFIGDGYTSDDDSDVGPQKYQTVCSFVRRVLMMIELLRKQPGDDSHEVSSSLSHPSGFTPDVLVIRNENGQSVKEIPIVGGSVLGVMEDMIRVGKAMGYSMDGLGHKTKKEWIKELTSKNKINFMAIQETKTHCVNHMDVKFMWGNSKYNYVYSEAVGNSGGILCVWEATVFKKDYATISDNFVAIYGTWLPSNSNVLFVVIYAPQQVSRKRILWDYVSTLIDRWNGEVVVLGDFNEVRNIDERRGSCFNPTSARVFDQFISASGLVDVKMEGYTFTWSHPSGSKMSKLDRFLVSEGIFSIFPSIRAVCLDCHLSYQCPIILCEVQADFGLIPFRFYHSWISLEGFDAMAEQTWRSFSHNDANRMIRLKKDSGPQGQNSSLD